MRAVIHSTKHIVQTPISQITTGTRENIIIFQAVESTIANSAIEVEEGALVKAVFVEMWLQNQGNLGHAIAILEKCTDAQVGASFGEMASLFTYTNKKNILWTHEGLTSNDGTSLPIPIIRQWVKIPKGKQRMGLGDSMRLSISNPSSNSLDRCGMFVFLEKT